MGDTVEYYMLRRLIKETKNENAKKILQVALDVIDESGYINLSDWENMTEEEELEELQPFLDEIEKCV